VWRLKLSQSRSGRKYSVGITRGRKTRKIVNSAIRCPTAGVLGLAGWRLGAVFGFIRALFAGTTLVSVLPPSVHPRMGTLESAANSSPLLEAPGFMLLNYGRTTPILTVAAHLAYGTIVGAFVGVSGR
jgi:hypothetical protein